MAPITKMSEKHLHRYSAEFSYRHNIRGLDTEVQMSKIVCDMCNKRLRYKDLVRMKKKTKPSGNRRSKDNYPTAFQLSTNESGIRRRIPF